MKQNNLKVNELLKDKPYLLEENYCPNVGYFPNGPSKYIQQILNGSDVYRYDIYSYRDDDDRIINLGGGSPIKYKTYKYVKKDILKYLNSNSLYNYPNTIGDENIKNILVKYLDSISIKQMTDENIIITASTTHAYSLIMKAIIKPNDVVIIPVPTYGLFAYTPEKEGGRIIFYELKEENNWQINVNELETLIINTNKKLYNEFKNSEYIPRVVAIYNQNPNNPLSTYLGEKDKELVYNINKLCYDNKVLIIDDLIYKDSIYNKNDSAIPMAIFSEYKDNIISIFGISKSYSLPAIRSGFIVANKYFIQDIRDKIFLELDSISMLSQIAISSIYNDNRQRVRYRNKFLNKINQKYLFNLEIIKFFIYGEEKVSYKVKKFIKKHINKSDYTLVKHGMKNVSLYHDILPVSGFFALVDFTKIKGLRINNIIIKNDKDLIIELYKKSKIKFLPGSSFGWQNKNDIIGRITFSKESKLLAKDMCILSKIINNAH